MVVLLFIAYGVLGLLAGILGGLLGISGGIITVPCLLFLFKWQGFPSAELMQLSIGTSLAAMVFNSLSSIRAHHYNKTIHWKLVKSMIPGLILGCLIGAFAAHLLPESVLEVVFGLFAILLGVYFFRRQKLSEMESSIPLPSTQALNSLGFLVGALSNILGIGGGTMTVPLFVKLKIPFKSAVASSTVTGLIVSFFGALAYLFFGLSSNYKYETTLGYIYLPAFIILAITTFISAPLGARLTYRLHTDKLRKLFAICLIFVGMTMMFR